jgi:hypothetical protein
MMKGGKKSPHSGQGKGPRAGRETEGVTFRSGLER